MIPTPRRWRLLFSIVLVLAATDVPAPTAAQEAQPTARQLEFFEREVRPLLAEHCYACHSAQSKKLQAGLLVDRRAGLLEGGDSGAAIVPGNADASLLIEAIRYESFEMPPRGKLPEEAVEILQRWVDMGAPWPDEEAPSGASRRDEFDLPHRKSEHWVWQPIRSPEVPQVRNAHWPRHDLDHFILKRLEDNGLQPAADVDRRGLLRRLCMDLIGLPPTPEQSVEFLADTSPQAVDRLVDRLLDSPQFGERWGRHWLDLVRYAESRGHEFDDDALNAFQYRDYIIRAFNADVPYDQLVREHIAGDLLPAPRLHPQKGFNESVLGTGFWFLGEWAHSPVDIRKDEADRFDNMIDVMSKTFLGVTVSCARCHDHKFDAISTADYYSLTGFLQSSDYRQVRFESMEQNRRVAQRLADIDTKYRQRITDELARHGLETPLAAPLEGKSAEAIVFHLGQLSPESFLQDGFIFGDRPRHLGMPYPAKKSGQPQVRFAKRGAVVNDPLWYGLKSVREKGVANRSKLNKLPRSGRTFRTPTFELTQAEVHCRVAGRGHVVACVDSHRLVAGPLHGETIEAIDPRQDWVTLNLGRYVGHRLHLEFTPAEQSQLEVAVVIQGPDPEVRRHLDEREQRLKSEIAKFSVSVEAAMGDGLAQLASDWAAEREALRPQIVKRSHTAMAMLDGTGEDARVLIRGNASQPGQVEPRHFLSAVAGSRAMSIPSGSGRLGLAEQINASSNPLTPRVIVNRLWHHLMGQGIVPTTDDFGVLGQRPTHPELLDHLASRFLQDGRSIKRMIRYIVLARTYQMSTHFDRRALEEDPNNQLWHYRPPKRLEGEAIRDTLLALSGRLDDTPFGEPVPIHLTSFMDGRGRPKKSGPLDGAGRRSIYVAVRRNFISPFMLAFDTPVPFSTMGRRNVSNVPAQALILMNDPFVIEQAQSWAQRALQQHDTIESRIQWMYEAAFARKPTTEEQNTAIEYVTSKAAELGDRSREIEVWSDLAHALVNTKEFIFLR